MFRKLSMISVALLATISLNAQTAKELQPACDSLQVLLKERTGVLGTVSPKSVSRKGNVLNINFTAGLGDLPWYKGDVDWFKSTLQSLLPETYSNCTIGDVRITGNDLEDYVVPKLGNSGTPVASDFRRSDPKPSHPFIEKEGQNDFDKGLTGRNIALWQSHGRYYEEKTDRWEWQRAPIFQTVEDMYTQTYVLPFLIPMLENAGAYVMTPRERDTQRNEVVADNDSAFEEGRGAEVRLEGTYTESGEWSDAGTGFADKKAVYTLDDNPFSMGTARKAANKGKEAEETKAVWTPEIPERGMYSVYISYKSLPNSTTCAHYIVNHLGASEDFIVNQTMGGGTWIYLGTFEFDKGAKGNVVLEAAVPEGFVSGAGKVVTADAVRFGGGMGKIARGSSKTPVSEYETSGLPSFAEGALYSMQWAGVDSTVMNLHKEEGDYTSDYADRGAWVGWMSGGSKVNPDAEGLKIPIDLSMAFHTDAGVTPNDSIVGTLAIYTLKCEDSDKLPNGESRLQSRTLADFIQTQTVKDVQGTYNEEWSRRCTWDRSYSESRTTGVPAMLLEFLSHQNFADMKYGLDPSFRFVVSRSIYKAMLKYLSSRYGFEYSVQPLPVRSFATSFKSQPSDGTSASIQLTWKPTVDKFEPTAVPTGYILYTRVNDGGFDSGRILDDATISDSQCSVDLTIEPGKIYSYKIVAFNDGGKSFPSEVLSIGLPKSDECRSVVVVNNFTRVSAPAWFDTPDHAGFISDLDPGVGYINDIGFIGDQYEFRRDEPWKDDDCPGFGGSYIDEAGKIVAGNTFDYTYIHGKALLASRCAFHSVSSAAFCETPSKGDFAADIICGKQVSTVVGKASGKIKYTVFTQELQDAIRQFTQNGGDVLVSGCYIATDNWDEIYPLQKDSLFNEKSKVFVQEVLGYKWMTNHASRKGLVWPMKNESMNLSGKVGRMEFNTDKFAGIYSIESPDGIVPASKSSGTILRYVDTNISAATCFNAKGYKAVCVGFPLETICKEDDLNALMSSFISYFTAPVADSRPATTSKPASAPKKRK